MDFILKKSDFHFGYIVVAAFVLLSFGPISFGLSCAGLFFTPIALDIGENPGIMSYYVSFIWISPVVTLSPLGKLMARQDARIFTTAAVIVAAVDLFALSFVNAIWQFFLGGMVMGIFITMLTIRLSVFL